MRLSAWILPLTLTCSAGCAAGANPAGPPSTDHVRIQHTEEPVDMNALDRRLYMAGCARSTDGEWWSCAMSIGQPVSGAPAGTFLMANSLRNMSLRGTITAGTLSHRAGGGGTASLSGTLTTGQAISFTLTDANDDAARDMLAFDTPQLSFAGEVRHGAIRLMRTLPLSHGSTNHEGFRFDPRIGLFILAEDLDLEVAPPPEALPVRVLEVVRPDPVIDFREDDMGGYTSQPGSDDNMPPS